MDIWGQQQDLLHIKLPRPTSNCDLLVALSNMLNPENLLLESGRRDSHFKYCRQKKVASDSSHGLFMEEVGRDWGLQ